MEDFKILSQKAIQAALNNKWDEAEKINILILKDNPQSIETLNRLACCYLELGKLKIAEKTYKKVLSLDHYNSIAQKNLKRLPQRPKTFVASNHLYFKNPCVFLEEPGKTKIISLLRLTTPGELSLLSSGDEVFLNQKGKTLALYNRNQKYLGILPDDMGRCLLTLIKTGNRYSAFIKSIEPNSLTILIREIFRSKRNLNRPAFALQTNSSPRRPHREEKTGNNTPADQESEEDELSQNTPPDSNTYEEI